MWWRTATPTRNYRSQFSSTPDLHAPTKELNETARGVFKHFDRRGQYESSYAVLHGPSHKSFENAGTSVISGYGGHIPGKYTGNCLGGTFDEMNRAAHNHLLNTAQAWVVGSSPLYEGSPAHMRSMLARTGGSIGSPFANPTMRSKAGRLNVPTALERTMTKVKQGLRAREVRGFTGIVVRFQSADRTGSGLVSPLIFQNVLIEMGIRLDPADITRLFRHFDPDQTGLLDYKEFCSAMRGRLPPRCRDMVMRAYQGVQASLGTGGPIHVKDLRNAYRAEQHPKVQRCNEAVSAVYASFIDTFSFFDDDGMVSQSDFEEYHECLHAACESDQQFLDLVAAVWDMPERFATQPTNKFTVVHLGGRRTVETVRPEAGVNLLDIDAVTEYFTKMGLEIDYVEPTSFRPRGTSNICH